jgi:O-antigen/teichoic acid export membrane protein
MVAAGWIIPRVFGAQFGASTPLLRIMIWQLVGVPFLWVPGLLLALGHPRRVAALATVDALAYLALLAALVPTFHATGAAVATLLRFVVWTALAIAFARRANREMDEAWKDGAHERAGHEITATPG